MTVRSICCRCWVAILVCLMIAAVALVSKQAFDSRHYLRQIQERMDHLRPPP
jgi:hypothetical protein